MRLEQLPVVLGALMALVGLLLLGDAFMADRGGPPLGERRRRARAERDRPGEAAVGLGMLCMAAALIGRDTWPYGNVAVIAGGILLVTGAALNHRFLRELLLFRGPARRQPERAPRGTEVAERHVEPAGRPPEAPAGDAARPTDEHPAGAPIAEPRPVEQQPAEHPAEDPAGEPRIRIR